MAYWINIFESTLKNFNNSKISILLGKQDLMIFKSSQFWIYNLHINGHFGFLTKCNLKNNKRLKREKKYINIFF